jgi:hypothetical protein
MQSTLTTAHVDNPTDRVKFWRLEKTAAGQMRAKIFAKSEPAKSKRAEFIQARAV